MSLRQRGSGLRAFAAAAALLSSAVLARASEGFRAPAPGEVLSPGAIVELRWSPVCREPEHRDLDEAELVLSLDGGTTFPIRVSPELNACASRYLWKVPSLPTAHARLALRGGLEGRNPTETLAVVGSEFRILSEPDGRVEALRRHAAEWWTTTPEPASLTAEDLLERRLAAPRDVIGLPSARPEGGLPDGPRSADRTECRRSAPASPDLAAVSLASTPSARRSSAPTPLRL